MELKVVEVQNKGILGMSPGLKMFVAACFAVGAVFTGANGLHAVSLCAVLAGALAGITAVAEVARHGDKSVLTIGVAASTLSVLGPAFALTATAVIPLGAVVALAAVPGIGWIAFWLASQRSRKAALIP